MTARSRRTDKAHRAAIDQLVRDAAQRGIGSREAAAICYWSRDTPCSAESAICVFFTRSLPPSKPESLPPSIIGPDGELVALAGARMIAGQVDHRDSELRLPRYILDIPPVESAVRRIFSPLEVACAE